MRTPRLAQSRSATIALSVGLILITWLVFGQTLRHDFVNYDDRTYVYGNPSVAGGLSLKGIEWAFTRSHARNWHPLTTISHMVDAQFFGLKPAGHHFTNVALHTLSVLLLFLMIRDLTGALWRSAFIAAVFAIHPLRVESVAWIAERKDVLSAVFFMMTLWTYVRYTRRPTRWPYIATLVVFALGLMSKPMLVTVPFVLLLLDYWPLKRGQGTEDSRQRSKVEAKTWLNLLVEKIPFLLLSAASCLATILAAKGDTGAMEQLPIGWRIENAVVSYAVYLRQMFWPLNLAVFYPYPAQHLPIWEIALVIAGLLAVTTMALLWRQRRPYVLVGWLWYLGMLVPVIGLAQIGLQSHADRYTYLPQIGLYLLITWLIADARIFRDRQWILAALAAVIVVGLSWGAWNQVAYWKNSESLWNRALAVTTNNDVAHNNLGLFYQNRGELDQAFSQFEEALKVRSANPAGHYNLSTALIHNNMGNVLIDKSRVAEAVLHYEKAVALRPDYADGHYNLGKAFFAQGRIDEAVAEWEATLSIQPDDADAHTSLGNALLQKRQLRQAIAHYEQAIKSAVPSAHALNNLAWLLSVSSDSSLHNPVRALELARRAVQLSEEKNPMFLRTLAAAYAENSQFAEAIETAGHAMEIARSQNIPELAGETEKELDLYRNNLSLSQRGAEKKF